MPYWCSIKEVHEHWQQEFQRLVDIFIAALKVKAYTLVGNNIFEVIYPISETRVMIKDVAREKPTTSVQRKNSELETCVVQIPLALGLRSHVCERKLVDYNSFRKPGNDLSGRYDLLLPPLILEG